MKISRMALIVSASVLASIGIVTASEHAHEIAAFDIRSTASIEGDDGNNLDDILEAMARDGTITIKPPSRPVIFMRTVASKVFMAYLGCKKRICSLWSRLRCRSRNVPSDVQGLARRGSDAAVLV